ncbi:DNA-binding protein [Candidatus Atribacteria bacterium MT.SAG.1]|nr:DNA-binding protein [Candidatus Atribacteria bacterium MT.SAG.1]
MFNCKTSSEIFTSKPLTVYQWARTNKIPAVKIGRIWRFKKNIIDNFLEKKPRKKKK